MKIIFTISFLILFATCYSENSKDNLIVKPKTEEIKVKLDTLKIETIKSSQDSTSLNLKDYLPWIVSLIIAVISVIVNIYIAEQNKKTTIENVNTQTTANTKASERQIQNSKDLAIQQIQNSRDLAITQFKSTLNTKNRQDWINEVRHCTSELLSQCAMINVVFSSNPSDSKKIEHFFEKMVYNKNKIAMLLNTNKLEQKQLLDPIYEIVTLCAQSKTDADATQFRIKEEAIIKASRELFDKHWNKIKEI